MFEVITGENSNVICSLQMKTTQFLSILKRISSFVTRKLPLLKYFFKILFAILKTSVYFFIMCSICMCFFLCLFFFFFENDELQKKMSNHDILSMKDITVISKQLKSSCKINSISTVTFSSMTEWHRVPARSK